MTLYKTDWMPPYLLGTGSFEASIKNMPYTPCPPAIHLLCLSFLGQFACYLIEIILNSDRPDFNETFAHHITTVALTAGMIFTNNRALGCAVAWQQTWCDIFVSIARIFASMPYKVPALISYTCMMSLWFWTRIHNFGYITYRVYNDMYYPEGLE